MALGVLVDAEVVEDGGDGGGVGDLACKRCSSDGVDPDVEWACSPIEILPELVRAAASEGD